MKRHLNINGIPVGTNAPLLIIAGPCVLENEKQAIESAEILKDCCDNSGVHFVFKGSFDKANRTSVHSKRGPGMREGLDILAAVKDKFGVLVTTDIHNPSQAKPASDIVDILQIPAFLCRQTDLLVAAAETDSFVNVKKGQFLAPDEMRDVVSKLHEANCKDIILTERGTFFGYNRLVNDFIGLGDLMEIGPPVCFDVTHSTQLPGADHTLATRRASTYLCNHQPAPPGATPPEGGLDDESRSHLPGRLDRRLLNHSSLHHFPRVMRS